MSIRGSKFEALVSSFSKDELLFLREEIINQVRIEEASFSKLLRLISLIPFVYLLINAASISSIQVGPIIFEDLSVINIFIPPLFSALYLKLQAQQ